MYSSYKLKLHILMMAFVIIGAVNWGAHALGYNFIDALSNQINKVFHSRVPINNIIYLIVAVAGLWLASKQTTWLPFLGKTVFPDSLVPLVQPTKPDIIVSIKTLPNVKIIKFNLGNLILASNASSLRSLY